MKNKFIRIFIVIIFAALSALLFVSYQSNKKETAAAEETYSAALKAEQSKSKHRVKVVEIDGMDMPSDSIDLVNKKK
ncbi:MAG: hypothetical protein FWF35_00585 [Elusimicrobia bacterium]|nr:hypothetical protein [Elusimicrobiota bacterium]